MLGSHARGQKKLSRITRFILGGRLFLALKAIYLLFPIFKDSYSQYGEDLVLEKLFPEKIGNYIDIGGGNPIFLSNTYKFYRKGWTGIVIEPQFQNHILAKTVRRRDLNLKRLASSQSMSAEFYTLNPDYFSTSDKAIAEERISHGAELISKKKFKTVAVRDLNVVTSDLEVTFLSIDVEGAELDVLNGIDFMRFLPLAILIEVFAHSETKLEVYEVLKMNGYQLTDLCLENQLWLHSSALNRIR